MKAVQNLKNVPNTKLSYLKSKNRLKIEFNNTESEKTS